MALKKLTNRKPASHSLWICNHKLDKPSAKSVQLKGEGALMRPRTITILRVAGLVILAATLVVIAAAAMPRVKEWLKAGGEQNGPLPSSNPTARLVEGEPNCLLLKEDEVKELGVRVDKVQAAKGGRKLELAGSLAPDTDHLTPIRSRFPGEVMEIGEVPGREGAGATRQRPIRNGDLVHKGDLLVVVYSKDLGLQKSALVDAISKLRLDEETLERLKKLYEESSIPERTLREGQRNVESDRVNLAAAERTLRAWQLTDKEIQAIKEEADRIAKRTRKGQLEPAEAAKDWARVEVRAPFEGTIVEKNVAPGAIIDTTTNLFMLADLRYLSAWANLYEEDLPAVKAMPEPRSWMIYPKSDPGLAIKSTIQEVRPIVDPTQHAALLKGPVDNSKGQLVSGQFITAVIQLPAPKDEAIIPTSALIEDGQESVVLVQPNREEPRYALRRVDVVRRTREGIYVRSDMAKSSAAAQAPGEGNNLSVRPLHVGEWVVVAGALEMRAALSDLQDSARTSK
jgi:cobalt-zinc-cadmium efflux system membrane fusion protein